MQSALLGWFKGIACVINSDVGFLYFLVTSDITLSFLLRIAVIFQVTSVLLF